MDRQPPLEPDLQDRPSAGAAAGRDAVGLGAGLVRGLDGVNRLLGGKVASFDMRAPDRIYLRVPGRADQAAKDAAQNAAAKAKAKAAATAKPKED